MEDLKRMEFQTTLRLSEPFAAIDAIHVETINLVMQSDENPEATMNIDEL